MSVTEASKTKIKNESGRVRRARDVRTFQRYAAAVLLPIPANRVSPSGDSSRPTTRIPGARSTLIAPIRTGSSPSPCSASSRSRA